MLTMCMIMNLTMTLIFMFLNHPMSMGLILMIQTICIVLITGFFSSSMWFSYVLFLIMIGGMLILLMYMTSLASNEKFKFSKKLSISTMIMMIITIIFNNINENMNFMLIKNSNTWEMINNINLLKNENIQSLTMMYNYPNLMITIMMINYLFLTLVGVVKITQSNQGPLRQKF
uniref:NADH-ubiquinone oxidoreductase chain 6 n=1 Tax=Nectoboreus dolerosus TaxID=2811604 RepID=A0A894JX52_9DYTI|nr:NADH dehydrogenase subunit 6 [Nectoboreus dolerosus]